MDTAGEATAPQGARAEDPRPPLDIKGHVVHGVAWKILTQISVQLSRVVVGIVTRWYREDEASTKAWVASLPQNPVRDRAATWLAWEVARGGDRAGAETIANGINDAEAKASAFKHMPKPDQ